MIVGLVGVDAEEVIFFLTRHKHDCDAYEMFMVCNAEGGVLDEIVSGPFSPYMISRADDLILKAATSILNTFRLASLHFHRGSMWKRFNQAAKSPPYTMKDLKRLCTLSSLVPFTTFDVRLEEFFCDPDHQFNLKWSSVYSAIQEDRSFSNCTFCFKEDNFLKWFLIKFHTDEVFILVEISSLDAVKNCFILEQEEALCNNKHEHDLKNEAVVERFVNWLLHHIWSMLG